MKSETTFRRITVDDCPLIDLERHTSHLGSLTVAQNGDGFPMAIKRLFYIYDIPADALRGGHAHRLTSELIIAVSGCFDIELDDGEHRRTVTLRHPSQGLLLPPGIWLDLRHFSSGAVCLTICDTDYDEAEFIRDYQQYLDLIRK